MKFKAKVIPESTEAELVGKDDWLPLKKAMGSSYKIVGSCDAQVVAMLMHRIRHLEEFILSLPIEGFVGDDCFIVSDNEGKEV